MQRIKKLTAIILSILTLSSLCVFGATTSAGAASTGAGLAEWALNAYYSGWSYVYGGSSPGAVDCSGLIYSYCGGARVGDAQLSSATESGSVSSGIPRVHGLGLYMPGHVGVYVGDGMEVDARGDDYGVCYQSVESSYMGWSYWFKLSACSYVTNGWEQFNGDYYYYENGQYIVDTSRNIDGTTYYFDSKGRSSQTPSDMSSSSSSSSSESSGSSSSSAAPSSYQIGSSGDEVKKIQERLTELGYYSGACDGEFGSLTAEAFKAFQTAAGLTADGIAGSDREILYSDNAPYAPAKTEETTSEETVQEETTAPAEEKSETAVYQNGDENDTVAAIQTKLAELGYFDIEVTGCFGDYTTQAVKNFQLANGLAATGIVDEETLELLNSTNAIKNPYAESDEETAPTTAVTAEPGPIELPHAASITGYMVTSEQNQTYADTASKVVTKTNAITQKVLSNSPSVVTAAATAQVKRTASVGLWFALVAVILAGLAAVFFVRDKKENTRYARYTNKKNKRLAKAENVHARW